MAKFVFAYRGGGVPQTEAEQKAVMDAWMGWFGAMGAAVVDGGNPFGASTTVRAPGAKGAGAGSGLSGYSVVQLWLRAARYSPAAARSTSSKHSTCEAPRATVARS
jgi:hypothetical protein